MFINLLKSQSFLTILALLFSLVFCVDLTVIGLNKVSMILSSGEKFNYDFPALGFSFSRVIVNFAYIILNIIYVIWILQPQTANRISNFSDILRNTWGFLIISFITYPLSTDIYMYLQYGLMSLDKINPYIYPASSFTSILSPFLQWSQTATYGPISQLFFVSAASTVSVSPVLGVYIFKTFCVSVHVLNAYMIWRFLKDNIYRNKITIAYLINPLLLTQHVADAHVDVFVCTTLIIFIGCLYSRSYVAANLALWMGFLVKTFPIVWFPLVGVFLIRQRRWKALGISIFLSIIIIIILSLTVFPTIEAWKSLLNPGVKGYVARSLHHILYISLGFLPNLAAQTKEILLTGFTSATYFSFAIYYSWILIQIFVKRNYSEANVVSDIGWVTLVLFVFATPWLMPWYPSVLLPIAALSINYRLFVLTSLTFCLFSSINLGTGSGSNFVSAITSISTIGPPILTLLFGRKFLNHIIERVAQRNKRAPSI